MINNQLTPLKNAALVGVFFICTMPASFAKPATAIFAGGCFWCMEPPFDKLPGVTKTLSGYTGGDLKNPSYQQVSGGNTGHYEAVKIFYDDEKVSYQTLLTIFWRNIDPLDAGGQFCDRGDSYRSAIFTASEQQKLLAENSKRRIAKQYPAVVTPILPAKTFYPAESYHQNYYQKNPLRYRYYRYRCGRDQRLKVLWPTDNH